MTNLTPSEELMMEVLAARYRLGETLWTFPTKMRAIANRLAEKGLIDEPDHGVVERTFRTSLTDKGREEFMDAHYLSPAERRWLKADPEAVIATVRKIFEEI